MSDSTKKWIIRDAAGRISGPFTTEKILYKIGRGEFSGEESVAYYPGGGWIPISQDPQFYDKLLESLSDQEFKIPEGASRTEQEEDFTHLENEKPKPTPEAVDLGAAEEPPLEVEDPKPLQAEPSPRRRKSGKSKRRSLDIELVDTRGEFIREILRRGRLPIAVGVIGLVLIYLLFSPSQSNEDRIHLIAPQRGGHAESADAVAGSVRQGVAEFVHDTFDGYIGAENNFVRAVEGNGKDAEVMALLCMTYLELWPYAYQDSADLKTVSYMVQTSSAVDAGGLHSSTCRTVSLIIEARYSEAKSLVESMLEWRANQEQTPMLFYYLKGLLLVGSSDYPTAIGYLQNAEHLWPQWTRPYVLDAQANIKLEKYSDAANILRRILAVNKNHSVAKIELGLLEYKYFSHFDRGQALLEEGLRGTAPRETLSRGYFGLAEIELKENNQSRALEYAQKAYSFNSSNASAQNLIVQLGGVEKLRHTKVKGQQLVFEGDQYFREGDWPAAQANYKTAFDEDPHNAVAAMKAAECLWKLSLSTEAIDWLNKAIKADPRLIDAYVLMADYQTQRFNFLAASKILSVAAKINPRSSEVYRGFALVELRRGSPSDAIAWGKKALQIYENDVDTQILMSEAYLAAGDQRLAYNYAAKAIEIDVNDRKAQTVYAEALMGLQGVDAAIDYMLRLIASYPLVDDYRLELGKLYTKDERYSEAEEVFKQIIKIGDKPKEAYMQLSKVLKLENQLNPALEYLYRAAVLDPADPAPLYQAGLIYLETGKGPQAMAQFQRVLNTNRLYPLVHYQMGRAALLMGQPDEALDQTREEKKINPNLADAYLLAAEAYTVMKQDSLCATEYQKAIKLQAQGASTYVKLAGCYRRSGNIDAANDMLKHAYNQEKGLADIYKEQGAIYEQKGDIQSAIEAYNQYFVLDPNAPDRQQIEQRIMALQRNAMKPE